MTKQLRLEQVLRQGAAVDGHERMVLPIAVEMQPARDQFLAGAAFAYDQHCAVRVGHLVNKIINLLHLPAGADNVLETITILQLLPQINVLPQRRLIIQRPLHRQL